MSRVPVDCVRQFTLKCTERVLICSKSENLCSHVPATHAEQQHCHHHIMTMADDRRARLAALAAKSGRNITPATEEPSDESKPKISFRNYVPKDTNLSTPADEGDDGQSSEQPSTKRLKPNAEPKSALERALAKTSQEPRQAAGQATNNASTWSTVTSVSAKKVNWDLKRDIVDKMEKLEKKTQKAIVQMLRERLEREAAEDGGEEDDSDLD